MRSKTTKFWLSADYRLPTSLLAHLNSPLAKDTEMPNPRVWKTSDLPYPVLLPLLAREGHPQPVLATGDSPNLPKIPQPVLATGDSPSLPRIPPTSTTALHLHSNTYLMFPGRGFKTGPGKPTHFLRVLDAILYLAFSSTEASKVGSLFQGLWLHLSFCGNQPLVSVTALIPTSLFPTWSISLLR